MIRTSHDKEGASATCQRGQLHHREYMSATQSEFLHHKELEALHLRTRQGEETQGSCCMTQNRTQIFYAGKTTGFVSSQATGPSYCRTRYKLQDNEAGVCCTSHRSTAQISMTSASSWPQEKSGGTRFFGPRTELQGIYQAFGCGHGRYGIIADF